MSRISADLRAWFFSHAELRAWFFSHAYPRAWTRHALFVVVLAAGWIATSGEAHAFSDPDRFAASAGAGGGGGRYFTGSPVDGYTCSVCHQGGVEPKLRIAGLPIDGYQPGLTYDVDVSWENPSVPQGLQFEMLGRDGHAAGTIALDQALVDDAARCTSADKHSAAYERVPPGRKVIGVEACGAAHVRFRFTPPDTPDLAFALSIVSSDKKGSAEGDGVFSVQRVLRRIGEPKQTGDCALARAERGSASFASLVLIGLGLLVRRRRAR